MKMKGKAVYAGPTNKDPLFRLIVFEDRNMYAAEVASLSNRYFESPEWMPGDSGHALFVITEDEFNLKDTDEKKLEDFIFELYTKIPEDRLIESFFVSIDNDSRRDMNLQPKCKTIDDNKVEKQSRRQYAIKHGIPYLNSVEKVYMIYDTVTGDSVPAITWNGYASVFTQRFYAEEFLKRSGVDTLSVKEFAKTDFEEQVKTWHALGIKSFYLNAGTDEHQSAVLRDDYMPDPVAKEWDYSGSALSFCILRYKQYAAQEDEKMQTLSKTVFGALCRELKETLFLCPFLYEGEEAPLPTADYVIHTSADSGEKVMLANDKILFYGGEKYRFAPSNVIAPGEMRIITAEDGDDKFIPAYTDFESLKAAYGEGTRVAAYTYDELCALAENDSSVSGIIINPQKAAMVIRKEDMDNIEKTAKEEIEAFAREKAKTDEENIKTEKEAEEKPPVKPEGKQESAKTQKKKLLAIISGLLALAVIAAGILLVLSKNKSNNGNATETTERSTPTPEIQTPAPLSEEEQEKQKQIEKKRQEMQDSLAGEEKQAVEEIKNLKVVYVVYDGNAGVASPYLRDGKTLEITGESDYPPDYNEEKQTWSIATYGFTQEEFAEYLKTAKANGAETVKFMTFDAKKTEDTGVYSYNGSTVSIDNLLKAEPQEAENIE